MSKEYANRFLTNVKPPPAAEALGMTGPHHAGDGGWKWLGRCPACAEEGHDRAGNHLVMYEDGRWGCVVHPGEAGAEHRRLAARLCPALRGGPGGGPVAPPPRPDPKKIEEARKSAQILWGAIREELSGPIDALGQSGTIKEDGRWHMDAYLDMWPQDDWVWIGTRFDAPARRIVKGEVVETPPERQFARNLLQAGDMQARDRAWERGQRYGHDHTQGAAWVEGAKRRRNSVAAWRFVVVEHDDADKAAQVALLRYARDVLGWRMRMVIDTTGKSLHGIFDIPVQDAEWQARIDVMENMGADPAGLRRAVTRVPGMIRQRDPKKPHKPWGQMQRILWIAPD